MLSMTDDNTLRQGRSSNCAVAVKAFRQNGERVALDWSREVAALGIMNKLKQRHIVRFLTAFERGKQEDPEHYVVFEWADGGNLGNFWDQQPKPDLTAPLVRWVIQQLHGLAEALSAAHNLTNNASYRHGDLKPANILWFRDTEGYGTLKIGDWGEAKLHNQITALRHNTTANYGTRRYEPPEMGLPEGAKQGRSRLYDIWGIGCITLEFVIWLLYGREGLKDFNDSNEGDYGRSDMFYELPPATEATAMRTAKIHRAVTQWMQHMSRDVTCRPETTALGDLLQIVRTGLLVVKLPEGGGPDPQADIEETPGFGPSINIQGPSEPIIETETSTQHEARLRASELKGRLSRIVSIQRETYWHQSQKPGPPLSGLGGSSLSVAAAHRRRPSSASLQAPEAHGIDYGQISFDPNAWTFKIDNQFATDLFSELKAENPVSLKQGRAPAKLCAKCEGFERWFSESSSSWISYETKLLREHATSRHCGLCGILWKKYQAEPGMKRDTVRFQRVSSTLNLDGKKVLTICRSSGKP